MAAKGNVAAAAALVIICNMYGCAPGANESQPSNPEPSPSGEYADQNESLSADIDEKSDSNDATYTLDEVTQRRTCYLSSTTACAQLSKAITPSKNALANGRMQTERTSQTRQ